MKKYVNTFEECFVKCDKNYNVIEAGICTDHDLCINNNYRVCSKNL